MQDFPVMVEISTVTGIFVFDVAVNKIHKIQYNFWCYVLRCTISGKERGCHFFLHMDKYSFGDTLSFSCLYTFRLGYGSVADIEGQS